MKQDYHASWSSHDEPRQPHALSILSPAHRADMAMTSLLLHGMFISLWKCATGKYAEQAKHTSHYCYQECNLSLYCGSLLPMCCYPYLVLYMDICSPFEEDLSCLCVSILSCKHQSCETLLTILEGGGERCDGEKTVQDVIFLRN